MTLTLGDALVAHRRQAGISDDGNRHKSLDWIHFGPLPLPIPNPQWRKRVVDYHDVSHLLSGYGTDWRGELDEGAFECGAGLGFFTPAWIFNLQGLLGGLILRPKEALRAFRRGRAAQSVYRLDLEALKAEPFDQVRARLVQEPRDRLDAGDTAALIANVIVGLSLTAVQALVVAAPLAAVGAALWWLLA